MRKLGLSIVFVGMMLGVFVYMGYSIGQTRAVGACEGDAICWGTRKVHEWVCQATTGGAGDGDVCDFTCFACSAIGGSCSAGGGSIDCTSSYGGLCQRVCCPGTGGSTGVGGEGSCVVADVNISCGTDNATYCSGSGTISTCTWIDDTSCSSGSFNDDYGCCGGETESHAECVSNSCTSVAGGGVDECSDDVDCAPAGGDSHNECINNACENVAGAGVNECSSNPDCLPSYDVSGGVYLDNTGSCSDKSSPVASAGSVNIAGFPVGLVGGDGTYTITDVTEAAGYVATLTGLDAAYACDCPGGCVTSVDVLGNVIDLDYFVTGQRDSWWQTSGGDVGSNASNLVSNIPNTCVGLCYPFMTRGSSETSGILTYYTGTNSFGGGGTASEGVDYVAQVSIPTNRGIEGYDYFYRQFEMGPSPDVDFSGAGVGKPGASPLNGRAYYSDGDLTLDGASWDLDPAESMVVFVDGNLVVDTQTVVDVGEFLAFVVSGNITFNTGDVDPASEVALVEGVFIADGNIITSTGSEKFVGEGIYIGWGGVMLGRDLGDDNTLNPGELFIHRPDFVTNSPDAMRRPVVRWEEVAP